MEMSAARRAMMALALAGCTLGGCDSGPKYEHAKVHGKVTYQGKPVTLGSVLFVPIEAPKEGSSMQPASGSINPDGTYELKSEADAGAILGEHKVIVIAIDGGQPEAEPAPKDGAPGPAPSASKVKFKTLVPRKYSDLTTTPLTRKVVVGDNTIDIELTD